MSDFDPSQEWLRRPDVLSGLVLGAWAATRSFGPSLMPRGTIHQALITGASAASGFAVGNATYGIVGGDLDIDGQLLAFGGATVAGGAAYLSLPDDAPLPTAALRAMGQGLAAGSLASLTVNALRRSRRPLRDGAVVGALGAAAGGISIFRSLRAQMARREDVDPPPPRPLPAVAQSATVAAVLAAVVNGYRFSGTALARILRERLALPPTAATVAGGLGATVAWGAVAAAFADTFVRGMELYNRVVDPGYDEPPTSAARSAGPGSVTTFSRTGRQGRRFILDVPSADDIASVMGVPARAEPVRVFVGYDQARTPEERVKLALSELERTGAYDRAVLIVGSPAGTGLVDSIPFETADYLLAGDSAGVAVQYERLPSLLAIHRVGVGGLHLRLLLEGIGAALDRRGAKRRPRVLLYGESLGSWAGQNALLGAGSGVAALDRLGVERALWVGSPHYSGWMRAVLEGGQSAESVVEVPSAQALEQLGAPALSKLRAVLLTHHNDPVSKLSLDLFVRRPEWLGADRPPGVSSRQRFSPVITVLQTALDTANATNPVPGVFRATGHDYRADLPKATALAYGLPRASAEQWSRIMGKLQADEAARVALMRRPAAQDEGDDAQPREENEEIAAATIAAFGSGGLG